MKTLNVLTVLLLTAAGLGAQEPVKVAVMDLKARSGIDNMTVSSLTDFVCTTILNAGEYEVIGKDDMQTMMQHIADRQLLECDDTKCLAKIGGALGVQLLVSGNIGMVGKMYLINIKLIDIEEATVQNRISEKYMGDETGLVSKVEQSVIKLFTSEGDPVAEPEPEPEPEPAVVVAEEPVHDHAPASVPETAAAPVVKNSKTGMRFGVIAGVNLGQVDYGDAAFYESRLYYSDYSDDMLPGVHVGLQLDVPLAGKMSLLGEAAFSQKNFFSYTQEDYYDPSYSYVVGHDRVSIDFNLNYFTLMAAPKVQVGGFQLYTGLRVGFLLGAYASGTDSLLDLAGNDISPWNPDIEEDWTDYFNSADMGFVIGGGYCVGHFSGSIRFDIGLTNIISDPLIDVYGNEQYNNTLATQLLIGYNF